MVTEGGVLRTGSDSLPVYCDGNAVNVIVVAPSNVLFISSFAIFFFPFCLGRVVPSLPVRQWWCMHD